MSTESWKNKTLAMQSYRSHLTGTVVTNHNPCGNFEPFFCCCFKLELEKKSKKMNFSCGKFKSSLTTIRGKKKKKSNVLYCKDDVYWRTDTVHMIHCALHHPAASQSRLKAIPLLLLFAAAPNCPASRPDKSFQTTILKT